MEDDISQSGSQFSDNARSSASETPEIMIIPVKTPSQDESSEDTVLRQSRAMKAILSGSEPDPSDDDISVEDQLARSTLSFHSVSDDIEETISGIESSSGVEADDSLVKVARCGAFWRSVGAETLIYMSSYGTGILANGLLVRFAGLHPMAGTLLFGSFSALAYYNAQILFTSLMNPPKDKVPENRKDLAQALNRYAFLPISWVIRGATAGTALSLIGDTDFGTMQAVSVPSSILIGPVTTTLRTVTRECLGGSIEIRGEDERPGSVGEAFTTAYGSEPNPLDENRTRRYGTLRNSMIRFIGMNMSTLAFFAYGGQLLSTYCIGDQEAFTNATETNTTANINDLLNEHCAAGQFTFALRELGFSVTYGVGILVVEPILSGLFNMVYDCFYPADSESSAEDSSDEENPRFEEVDTDDSSV